MGLAFNQRYKTSCSIVSNSSRTRDTNQLTLINKNFLQSLGLKVINDGKVRYITKPKFRRSNN